MADLSHKTDGPSPLSEEGYDESLLPDFHRQFVSEEDIQAFANALSAPDPSPSSDDLLSPFSTNGRTSPARASIDSSRSKIGGATSQSNFFITAQSDWAPVTPKRSGTKTKRKGERKKGKRIPRRSSDETREGYLYTLLKWPMLGIVIAWVIGLGASYLLTRLYIWLYEYFIAWRGKRNRLRRDLYAATNYGDWVQRAQELDTFLGNDKWKSEDTYAYYDHKTIRRVYEQIRKCRQLIEEEEKRAGENGTSRSTKSLEDLKSLIEACVKNNFVGVENSRLYSQTYYGTKDLVQEFIDEGTGLFEILMCQGGLTIFSGERRCSISKYKGAGRRREADDVQTNAYQLWTNSIVFVRRCLVCVLPLRSL